MRKYISPRHHIFNCVLHFIQKNCFSSKFIEPVGRGRDHMSGGRNVFKEDVGDSHQDALYTCISLYKNKFNL